MHLFKVYIIQFLTGMIYIRPWPYGQNSLEYDYIFTHYSKIEQLEQRLMVGCFFLLRVQARSQKLHGPIRPGRFCLTP